MVRHAFRRLGRSLTFAVIAVLTLGIGIGANTAIFSVVHSILLKPLPYPESDRLASIWLTAPGIGIPELNASPATYFTFREEGRAFEDIGIWRGDSASVTGAGEPEQVDVLAATDAVLPLLRVRPIAGRWFSRQDDSPGTPETVMLSHGYWQRRFGGDPGAIGRSLVVDGRPREIIGVLPAGFRLVYSRPEILLPLRLNRGEVFIGNFSYQAVARLRPGVSTEQANQDVARMLPMMLRKFPPAPGMTNKMLEDAKVGPDVRPLRQDVVGDVGKVLWVLMGTVGIVLLIACANVANLLLVRADGRQQEFAVRTALGANWTHIAREMLAESLSLAALGGLAGLALSYGALRLLVAIGPSSLPRLDEIGIDGTVLAVTFGLTLLSGVFFGLVPVVRYAGPRVANALRAGGRTMSDSRERHRTRGALVVVQVGLAVILLISSGLMLRSLSALRNVQPGFTDPDRLLTLRVSIPETQVKEPEAVARMYHAMLDKVSAVPGVTSAALTDSATMDGNSNNDPIYTADKTYSETAIPPIRRYKHIGPGTFRTVGNRLVAGRDVTWEDVYRTRNVVLVSENLARELWGSPAAALGRRVRENPKGTWREVVGVAGDHRDDGVHQKPTATVYWPMLVRDRWEPGVGARRSMVFLVRSSRTGSSGFLEQVQRAVWSVNPNVPTADVRTMRQIVEGSMARTSFTLVMLSLAAATALVLGVVGVYGVISYSISQRTREIGIRMALGASEGAVRQMFVRHGLVLTAVGVACGFAAAAPLTRLMASLLYGTSALDPATYAGGAAVLVLAALVAAYIPARRATRVEPVDALRME